MKTNSSDFFKEVTLRICSSLNINQALSDLFEYLERFMPIDALGLFYKDPSGKKIVRVASIARKEFRFYDQFIVPELEYNDEMIEYLKEKPSDEPEIQIVNDPEEIPPEALSSLPFLSHCSNLSLYLKIREESVGKLCILAEGNNRYNQKHSDLLLSVREPIAIAMSNAKRYLELTGIKDMLAEDNLALANDLKRASGVDVVGADFGLREVMEQVRQIARSNSPALLLGETGTGKEVIANAIHMASPRRKRPMTTMQCGAVPETLLDSELFGHEKGAFTGASEQKRGRFERADGGTLFLDEIGELSTNAQVKLLRVLQEKRFERVGGTRTLEVDVRVIAATHRDLEKMVREGTFREDLWYRLNVLPIRIPPLRLRREDISSLVQYFIERKVQEMNLMEIPKVDQRTLGKLKEYDWPGNIRELQNIVERALILSRGNNLKFPDLVSESGTTSGPVSIQKTGTIMSMDQAIGEHIRHVLDHVGGQIAGSGGAAELLQMNPSTLRFRIKKLGLQRKKA